MGGGVVYVASDGGCVAYAGVNDGRAVAEVLGDMSRRRREQGDQAIAVGYVRVSTDRQELGPHAQRRELELWCYREGATLAVVFEDQCSGTTAVDAREGLLGALAAGRRHGAGVLLVARLDRLARDVFVATTAERLAEFEGMRVVSADGSAQLEGPEGALQRTLQHAIAQYERAVISLRTRQALRVKRERGERSNSKPIYGHRFTDDGRTEPVFEEQAVIRRLRRWRNQGRTVRWMTERLNELGTPARGTRWHPTTVNRILKREIA